MNKAERIEQYKKNKVKEFYRNKRNKQYLAKRIQEAARKDVILRIINNLSSRATTILKHKCIKRNFSHKTLIGCSDWELRSHLSQLFTDGMDFTNYGFWEVDHIIPISSFDLRNEDELFECFNYKNLQPLWLKDNRSKGDKVVVEEAL